LVARGYQIQSGPIKIGCFWDTNGVLFRLTISRGLYPLSLVLLGASGFIQYRSHGLEQCSRCVGFREEMFDSGAGRFGYPAIRN
jgi:hypothetical protein